MLAGQDECHKCGNNALRSVLGPPLWQKGDVTVSPHKPQSPEGSAWRREACVAIAPPHKSFYMSTLLAGTAESFPVASGLSAICNIPGTSVRAIKLFQAFELDVEDAGRQQLYGPHVCEFVLAVVCDGRIALHHLATKER